MESAFLNFIKKITNVPPAQEEKFNKLLSLRNLQKGDDFICAGQFSKSIAFVREGLFRYYYTNDDGIEFTKGFFPENTVLSSYSAILENRPSYFTIQALEDSLIEVLDYRSFIKLFEEDPCWNNFLIAILQKGYVAKESREREFLLFDAEQRYKSFLERYPTLEKRVKQNVIASYLGIAPESLSRIRKKVGLLT